MTTITFRNKEDPERNIDIVEVPFESSKLTNNNIKTVRGFETQYYASDVLIIELTPEGDETEVPKFQMNTIGKAFTTGRTEDTVDIPVEAIWKYKNSDVSFRRDNYLAISLSANEDGFKLDNSEPELTLMDLVDINSEKTKVELTLTDDLIEKTENAFPDEEMPDFGLLKLTLNLRQGKERASKTYLLKYTHNPPLSSPNTSDNSFSKDIFVQPEPQKESISKISSFPYTFENLFVPVLSSSFVYNFFEQDETNFEKAQQKDYTNTPLRNIPRYIKLTWSKAPQSVDTPPKTKVNEAAREEAGIILSKSLDNDELASAAIEVINNDEEGKRFGSGGGSTKFTPDKSSEAGRYYEGVFIAGDSESEQAAKDAMASQGPIISEDGGVKSEEDEEGIGASLGGGESQSSNADDPANEELFGANINKGQIQREANRVKTKEVREKEAEATKPYRFKSKYVGYIIVKQRVNEENEVLETVEKITVPSRDITKLIDWKIAYGERYRYTIKSVFAYGTITNAPLISETNYTINKSNPAATFDVDQGTSRVYYFDSNFSDPAEASALEFKRPDHPINFRIVPNSKKHTISLYWTQKNEDRDVKGYNVYKKTLGSDVFDRANLELLPVRHNHFIDDDVDVGEEYVYTVESVDQHFNKSTLSTQYKASINDYSSEKGRCENDVELHERAGQEIFNPTSFPEESSVIKFMKKFNVMINPLFRNLDEETTYLLKVKSLDTAHEKEIKLNFNTKVINHREDPNTRAFPSEPSEAAKKLMQAEKRQQESSEGSDSISIKEVYNKTQRELEKKIGTASENIEESTEQALNFVKSQKGFNQPTQQEVEKEKLLNAISGIEGDFSAAEISNLEEALKFARKLDTKELSVLAANLTSLPTEIKGFLAEALKIVVSERDLKPGDIF